MDKKQKKPCSDHVKEDAISIIPEIQVNNGEDVINITLNPSDLQNATTLNASATPLFIKKLWKMINDEANKESISWNKNGDGFIIQDQLKFISQTLPRYFKHNQLSSFIRQLNMYDFHKFKAEYVEGEALQFSHPFFLKDIPQLLPLIKRKPQGRQRAPPPGTTENSQQQQPPKVQEIMSSIKDIKTKSDVISSEMAKLRQENAALWGEMNSLRVKYSKQTKVINKLIHFLIAYMQKHHKSGRTVSASNSNKYLKTGPKIMELDYRYRNNPHEFWSEFDKTPETNEQEAYTVVEPSEVNNESTQVSSKSPSIQMSSTIEEILPGNKMYHPNVEASADQGLPAFDYTKSNPSSSKSSNSALQRTKSSQENVGYLIDNSRVEMSTIKELLKNLTPEDMTTFYKLVNENYRNQEDDLTLDSEQELVSLADISPQGYEIHIPEEDFSVQNQGGGQAELSALNDIIEEQNKITPSVAKGVEVLINDDIDLGMLNEDLLHSDEILNNASVDQYFNID